MKISKQATKGHLLVGIILVLLSITVMVLDFIYQLRFLSFGVYFFGVWGGVELGRYLEHVMQAKD